MNNVKLNTYGTVFTLSRITTDLAIALGIGMVNTTLGYVTLLLMTAGRVSSYLYQNEMVKAQQEEYAKQTADLTNLLSMYTVNPNEEQPEQKDNVTLQ